MTTGIAHVVRTQRGILLGAAVLLGFVIGIPIATGAEVLLAPSGPYSRAKIVCPRTAARGTTVAITGSGFPGTASVAGSFTNPASGTFAPTTTSATGSFSSTATISPTSPTGSQVLTVTVTKGVTTVTASCTIKIT